MRVRSNRPQLLELLSKHPRVTQCDPGSSHLEYETNRWRRILTEPTAELGGLVELIDNNPLVCADEAFVPSPEGTLALIALGPIAEAGMMVEPPVILYSFEPDETRVERDLETANWKSGATVGYEKFDIGPEFQSVRTALIVAKIITPDSIDEIDELYDERFSRSFLVHRVEPDELDPGQVLGRPFAKYALSITAGDPHSLLTIRVIADARGKLGDSQSVHMMNIMCGFEESLGLE